MVCAIGVFNIYCCQKSEKKDLSYLSVASLDNLASVVPACLERCNAGPTCKSDSTHGPAPGPVGSRPGGIDIPTKQRSA